MKNNDLLNFYSIQLNHFKNMHSAGDSLFFRRPCIGYMLKGYAKFLYKGKTTYAYAGDLIYIAFETRYQSIFYGSPDVEWYSIDFEFGSKYKFYDYRFQILRDYPRELFEKMYSVYKESPMLSVGHFYSLLDDIYGKLKTEPTGSSYKAIEPAVEYIENHYKEDFPIKTLANLCHLSESGFFKLFKNATGVTPITYKHNIMIQQAVELITNTDKSIEDISGEVGFPSSNYFRKVFFKLVGKNPKELRIKK